MKKRTLVLTLCSICILSVLSGVSAASDKAAYRYNQSGVKKLREGSYLQAIQDLKMAHQYKPSSSRIKENLAIAYNNYGFSLMEKGDFQMAIDQFQNAYHYDRDNAYTLYNLGQAYYQVQNMEKAEKFLEKAWQLRPGIKGLRQLLKKVRTEGRTESAFDRLETMHFIIASAPDLPVSQLSYIRTNLEEAYGRVGMFLEHYPDKRFVTILFSEENYDRLLKDRPHWTLGIYDGKLRIPANRFKYSDRDVIKIIYHEYAHALVHELTDGKCPSWLNEGIASKVESLVEPFDRELSRKYIRRYGLVPFIRLPDDFSSISDRRLATLCYMESFLLVDFILHRSGRSGLRNILKIIARGDPAVYALTKVTGLGGKEFQQQWEAYIRDRLGLTEIEVHD